MAVKVYLSVGHGVRPDGTFDPGATYGDWNEQVAGDVIVKQAAWLLRAAGVTVTDEAYKDDPNYVGTTKAANAWGADLLVGVHHDWHLAPVGGFGLWLDPADKVVADALRAAYLIHGLTVRENVRRTDLYKLQYANMPVVIWEAGRIGQYSWSQLLLNGDAVACGIGSWLGVHSALPSHGVHIREDDVAHISVENQKFLNEVATELRKAKATRTSLVRTIEFYRVVADSLNVGRSLAGDVARKLLYR
jgi:hypothetical protein